MATTPILSLYKLTEDSGYMDNDQRVYGCACRVVYHQQRFRMPNRDSCQHHPVLCFHRVSTIYMQTWSLFHVLLFLSQAIVSGGKSVVPTKLYNVELTECGPT